MNIRFFSGGPAFHPVQRQAEDFIIPWLGSTHRCQIVDGANAFENLDSVDLLVLMGLHWPGMSADWGGHMTYTPLNDAQKKSFTHYVSSGRPLLVHHGAILSYDDWPEFGRLMGFAWIWDTTAHSPIHRFGVKIHPTHHPLTANVGDYSIEDELYFNVKIAEGFAPQIHATAHWEGRDHPMVLSGQGGRAAGAGRVVYLANGHDAKAMESPAMKQLWINAVRWLGES